MEMSKSYKSGSFEGSEGELTDIYRCPTRQNTQKQKFFGGLKKNLRSKWVPGPKNLLTIKELVLITLLCKLTPTSMLMCDQSRFLARCSAFGGTLPVSPVLPSNENNSMKRFEVYKEPCPLWFPP